MHWGEAYLQLSTLNEWLVFCEEEVYYKESDLVTVRKAGKPVKWTLPLQARDGTAFWLRVGGWCGLLLSERRVNKP